MKKEFMAAAALLAVGVNAQVSGPNRPGPGTSPGTFQTPTTPPSLPPPVPSDTITTSPRPGVTAPNSSPAPGSTTITPPRTSIDTPNAVSGAIDPFQSTLSTNRLDGSINDSRDWERGVGAPAGSEIGRDVRRPMSLSDITPPLHPLGAGTASPGNADGSDLNRPGLSGGPQTPKIGSDLNTTGVNTPPRMPEQPLDRALSAKIRAQLSMTPVQGQPVTPIPPEMVRDMRITSQNGKVILEGMVDSEKQKDLIEFRAKEVQGVANVENRLRVRNRAVGAPGSSQSGRLDQNSGAEKNSSSGQTPQNSSDLRDEHRELTPDR